MDRGMGADTGKPLSGVDHLRQSIRDILTTRIGTRVMRREYGSNLPALVDRPVNDALLIDLYAATIEALNRWEPRFRVSRVEAVSIVVGGVELALEGFYLPEGREIRLEGVVVT